MFRLRLKAINHRMFFCVLAILLLVAAAGWSPLNAAALSPTCKIDLSLLGKGGIFPLARLIEFVGNNKIAVAMIANNPGSPNLVHRGDSGESSPYLLHSALFDANTGRVLKQARWPAENLYRSGLIAAPDSKLLVLLGNRVVLFNDDLEPVKHLRLPRGGEHGWLASASPTGRNVLFQEDTSAWPGPSTWVWVDAENLRIVKLWKNVNRQMPEAISDDYMTYAPCFPWPTGLPCKLSVRSLRTGAVRELSDISYTPKTPEFVSENLLYTAMGGSFSIIDVQKQRGAFHRVLGSLSMDLASPVRAAGSTRFIVPLLSIHQGGTDLRRLFVFDGPTAHRTVVRLRGLSTTALKSGWFPGSSNWLALSADGQLLAIMQDFRTLLIYRLPPPSGQLSAERLVNSLAQ